MLRRSPAGVSGHDLPLKAGHLSASIRPISTMNTKTISFRCPEDILKEMELLCDHNKVDRSCFIVQALQSMLAGLAEQGLGEAREPLPPSAIKEDK